ncbi:MAG: hypothetical protein U5P10_11505 [Spirochaetia bacterium]|nr:hypothetical protein [Spirochaetia bacterium]
MEFEHPGPIGYRTTENENYLQPDELLDDTALAYLADDGLVIITGCSHAGVCNIVEAARRITGIERVVDIIGGLHLLDPPKAQLDGTVEYLSSLKLPSLRACHCTDLHSKIALSTVAPLTEVGSGLVIEY